LKDRIQVQITPPSWLKPIYEPNDYNFIVVYGGRGGGKTFNIVEYLIYQSFAMRDCYFLCAREIQKSLLASTYSVLDQQIKHLGLSKYFSLTREGIVNKVTGVKFIFRGLWRDPDSIKGIPNLKIIYIDEAANISNTSWNILPPTLTRNEGSKLICTFNPKFKSDVIYREFIENNNRINSFVIEVSYRDNPVQLPDAFYLEAQNLKDRDYEEYLHVYEGHCVTNSSSKVFKHNVYWKSEEFEEPYGMTPRFGLDLGFSLNHPTFGVRLYIQDRSIYITHEAVKCELDTDEMGKFLEDCLPDVKKYPIYVDNSRPETVFALKKQDLKARSVEKGQGSVEDGIEFMKSHEMIYIHPRCVKLIDNFEKYVYKVDRGGDVMRDIVKKDDDGIDAVRYALERLMKSKGLNYEAWPTI